MILFNSNIHTGESRDSLVCIFQSASIFSSIMAATKSLVKLEITSGSVICKHSKTHAYIFHLFVSFNVQIQQTKYKARNYTEQRIGATGQINYSNIDPYISSIRCISKKHLV